MPKPPDAEITTWQIADCHLLLSDFLRTYRSRVPGVFSWWWTTLFRYDSKKTTTQHKLRALNLILIQRYKGLFAEVVVRASQQQRPSAQLSQAASSMALESLRRLSRREAGRYGRSRFGVALWTCISREAEAKFGAAAPGIIEPLQTKFMLRPFVDELGPTEHRGSLRLHVYGTTRDSDVTGEAAALLPSSLAHLHALVTRHRNHRDLTAGAIDARAVQTADDVRRQYMSWLFPP